MSAEDTSHRLFFALVPAGKTQEAIQAVQRRTPKDSGRAVPPERLHATLAFLGNQPGHNLARAKEIASGLEFEPCVLTLDRYGHFPRARVAWLGPSRTPPQLQAFHGRLCTALADAGVPFDDRSWRPHVTLYRDLRTRSEKISFQPVEWRVQDFRLMESVQRNSGLQYICRGRWPA